MSHAKSPPNSCDRELLQRSLEDMLSDDQEEQLAEHLSSCAKCQRELERMAAEHQQWRRVGDALRRESPVLSRSESPVVSLSPGHEISDDEDSADSVTDFAVHFLEPSSVPGALGRLGTIDILEVIGRGGMGIVLKGMDESSNRIVAVKILGLHLAGSGAARKRFAREAQSAAIIAHPNVMPILAVHGSGKLPHLVMPFVSCESLEERIRREGPAEPIDVLRVGLQVASGLAAAHSQGLVHRDIKPANILIENGSQRVLLTDFGLARAVDDAALTRTGVIAGTPQYMSPEQARGDNLDARSDLFSLGSVLYAMAAGRPPFRAESSLAVLRRITDRPPRPLCEINSHIPPWLAAIVEKLHANHPANRFQSASDLAKTLEQCLAHLQQPNVSPLPASLLPDIERIDSEGVLRHFKTWGWTGVVLALVLLLTISVAVAWRRTERASNPTEVSPPVKNADRVDDSTRDDLTRGGSIPMSASGHADWNDHVAEQIRSVVDDTSAIERRPDMWFKVSPGKSPNELSPGNPSSMEEELP